MTEREKMISGELYNSEDAELYSQRVRVRQELFEFNSCPVPDERMDILRRIFGVLGEGSFVETGLKCDYGNNIFIGKRCFINFYSVMLDCARIYIGDDVLVGPNVGFYTPVHPLIAEERVPRYDSEGKLYKLQYARSIKICDRVWIGGGVCINGGVTIGEESVIGSGSVVTKDIPPGVFAAGNPCRVIRRIAEKPR